MRSTARMPAFLSMRLNAGAIRQSLRESATLRCVVTALRTTVTLLRLTVLVSSLVNGAVASAGRHHSSEPEPQLEPEAEARDQDQRRRRGAAPQVYAASRGSVVVCV